MSDRLTVDTTLSSHLSVSAVTGAGLNELLAAIGEHAREALPQPSEILPWKARHVELLLDAADGLQHARSGANLGLEMRAEWLRSASRSLGRIAGDVDVEDLLDSIFSNFCIGK